jgi:hypothetical protein
MAESAIVLATTIKKYVKGAEDDVMRNQKVLAMLKSKGNVNYNQSGNSLEWRTKFRRQPLLQMADGGNYQYQQQNKWKIASLGWRGYAAGDSETKKQKLMNKGAEAIINRYSQMTKELMDDMDSNFALEFYVDGNAAGKENAIHGIESFMGTAKTSAGTGAVSGSVAMSPSESYAGLNTDLGNNGGTWSGAWPLGVGSGPGGSNEYDFWSPLILDVTSTLATASGGWTSATATWQARAPEIVRYGIIHSGKNTSLKGMMDMILMDREMYRLFLDNQTTKERIIISAGAKKGGLVSLGFGDTFNYDGVDITQEYGIPANTAYGWNMSKIDLNSLQPTLFDVTGPLIDVTTQSDLFSIDFYGNLRFESPRNFLKIAAYGSNGA